LSVIVVRVLVLVHDAPRRVLGGHVGEGAVRGERGRYDVFPFARAPALDLWSEARERDGKPLFADEKQCKVQALWLDVVPAVLQSEVGEGEIGCIVGRLDGEKLQVQLFCGESKKAPFVRRFGWFSCARTHVHISS
jgi:hypothetical protein